MFGHSARVSKSTSVRHAGQRGLSADDSGNTSPRHLQISPVAAVAAGRNSSVDSLTRRLVTQLHRSIDKHLETRASTYTIR